MEISVDGAVSAGAVSDGAGSERLTRTQAWELGRCLQDTAAAQAQLDHSFCDLVDRFDAGGAVVWFEGVKSVAHYLAWACSMNGGTAREHVRVARALREMPTVKQMFAEGRFSYSKVRELTRVVGLHDEDTLCALALEMTASQLARTIAAYRTAAGTRIRHETKRRVSWCQGPDGLVRMSVVMAPEEAALMKAALEVSQRRLVGQASEPQAHRDPGGVEQPDRVHALLDLAATFLEHKAPADPDDDHTLVVVHVSADQLDPAAATAEPGPGKNVPAGTLQHGISTVEGVGPIEAATAQRMACTAQVVGAIVDHSGDVLALGRTTRLATRAQKRALRIRERGLCQFPSCHQTAHLDAHHLTPWSEGGPTDLANLMLLCRRHHVLVHEGGLQIVVHDGPQRYEFLLPDGKSVTHPWHDIPYRLADLHYLLARAATQATNPSSPPIKDERHPRIFPLHGGHGFSLHECVQALFTIQLPTAA